MSGNNRADLKDVTNIRAAVGLPLAWALVSGVLAGVLAGSWAWATNAKNPLSVGVMAAGVVAALAWLLGLSFVGGLATKIISPEENTNPQTLNAESLRVEVAAVDPSGAFGEGRFLDLPISRERLEEVAQRALISGFSHAAMCGRHRPLSRAEYEAIRDELLQRGMLSWVNPHGHSQGLVLSGAGRAFFRRLAGVHEPPTNPLPPELRAWFDFLAENSRAHMHTRE